MRLIKADPKRRYHSHDTRLGFIDRILIRDEKERPAFNRRMFDEDFARLFNSIDRHRIDLFHIHSNEDELAERLLSGVETRYRPNSIDETVRELVEEIAQSLIWFGSAYYFLKDDPERRKVHLSSFDPNGVVRLFGTIVQWVPRRTQRNFDRGDEDKSREIRVLDATKVMRFVMPRTVKRLLSAQNRTLAVLDKHKLGVENFHSRITHEDPNPTNHFNLGAWKETQDRVLYRATRGTGWNGRKHDSSKQSDFFDCQRLIRFRRNQLVLRDDILTQLSAELSKVGKTYNAEFTVEISGSDDLPSVKELDEFAARLTREEVGFTEIIDYCFKR